LQLTKAKTSFHYRADCRFFVGEKPCVYRRVCDGCEHYRPRGKRVLIIKLAAPGDVLRTTPLLLGLKRKFPESYITWLTDPPAAELLRFTEHIDVLLEYSCESVVRLLSERPEVLICLDKEPRACCLASLVRAKRKYGFGWSDEGVLIPFGPEAEYAFRLGFDDELKFRINQKTYQEIIFEACGLTYDKGFEYVFALPEEVVRGAGEFLGRLGLAAGRPVVGLNTGAGRLFATKRWTIEGWAKLAMLLRERLGIRPLLLGGPLEVERNRKIEELSGGAAIDAGCDHRLSDFAGIISHCDVIITGDTLAMHLAIALRRRVVVIMGPTCPSEIELFGRGTKIVADVDCAPCYKAECDVGHICMRRISPEAVFAAAKEQLEVVSRV